MDGIFLSKVARRDGATRNATELRCHGVDSRDFARAEVRSADTLSMSALAVLEPKIVLFARLGPEAVSLFDQLLEKSGIVVVPFDDGMAGAAFDAFRRFGKRQGHPVQLNIVDCTMYALAKSRWEPLLFKDDDFARTDIVPALA